MNPVSRLADYRDDSHQWISSDQLAALANVSERAIQLAFKAAAENGKKWRGVQLIVRTVPSKGRGGMRYEVAAASLPEDLAQRYYFEQQTVADLPEAPSADQVATLQQDDLYYQSKGRTDKALWRHRIIQPVLQTPKGSRERTAAIKKACAEPLLDHNLKLVTIKPATIYNWLNLYADGGIAALAGKPRKDTGHARTLITRKYDKACPFERDVLQSIAEQLTTYIRSLWAAGAPGWRKVEGLASTKLLEISREYGFQGSDAYLLDLCKVGRRRVESERDYALIAVNDKDAKTFFDKHLPRIHRNIDGLLPMDIIVGDVHPIDVKMYRPDGSEVYPRAIAWQDVATNRMYWTIVMLEKGEGVRRGHVAASFASMAQSWGLPKRLYLDNGSEYNWAEMINAFVELSRLTGSCNTAAMQDSKDLMSAVTTARNAVMRARPYNAPAKPIEGLFSVMEQGFMAMLTGWVGGDRQRKKTHNVGKAPLAYPGTFDEFHADIESLLKMYHATPQQGYLKGNCPAETLQRHIDNGWGKVDIQATTLLLAFARQDTRKASQGYISWNGVDYSHDDLLPYSGQNLEIRVADHDPRYAFVFKDKRLICIATPDTGYRFDDPAGAKESSRRATSLRRHISEMKKDCDRLELMEEVKRDLAHRQETPESPTSCSIEATGEVGQMLQALQDQATQALENASSREQPTQLSQWQTDDDIEIDWENDDE